LQTVRHRIPHLCK